MRGHSRSDADRTERPEETRAQPDFRVKYSPSTGWEIEVISSRAHAWIGSNAIPGLLGKNRSLIKTNLSGVNQLVHSARTAGLRTEYLGPQRIVII